LGEQAVVELEVGAAGVAAEGDLRQFAVRFGHQFADYLVLLCLQRGEPALVVHGQERLLIERGFTLDVEAVDTEVVKIIVVADAGVVDQRREITVEAARLLYTVKPSVLTRLLVIAQLRAGHYPVAELIQVAAFNFEHGAAIGDMTRR